jgi:hypothetical protein
MSWIFSEQDSVVDFCGHGGEPLGSIKMEFLDQLNNYQKLKEDPLLHQSIITGKENTYP